MLEVSRRVVVLCGCLLLGTGLLWLPQSASAGVAEVAANFAPHRAVYTLDLDRERSESTETSGATGRLDFEWADVCDGWAIKQRTRVFLERTDGATVDFGFTLDSWEAKDGLGYRFFIKRFSSGDLAEEVRGEASLESLGGPGRVSFTLPSAREVKLPPGTNFPTWHSFEVIDAASKGRLPLWRAVFDGSGEEDGLSGVSAVLARALRPQREGLLDSPLIQAKPSWRLLLGYFSMNDNEALPEHEQSVRLFPNGVAEDLLFDYGDFALRARLVRLEALPEASC
jgi:hypothetical protein